ncbi:MAG TPA: hypothetical protein VJN95_02230 [Gemmatimonadales bacterium]|nr:hypothetical protein [Gemmatimonadales bacterium]
MTAPAYLWVFMLFANFTIIGVLLFGVDAALARGGVQSGRRRHLVRSAALLLAGWMALATALGWLGIFEGAPDRKVPWIALAVVIPISAGIRMLRHSAAMREVVRAVPQSWLIGLQAYRGLGSIFLVLLGMNLLPGVFALPAGFGDVLVGLLALPVAALVSGGARREGLVVAWNILGIADLVIALTAGFLSSPGPLQQLSLGHPNYLAGAYPLVLIPVFAVPLSIVLHAASLGKVGWRQHAEPVAAVA